MFRILNAKVKDDVVYFLATDGYRFYVMTTVFDSLKIEHDIRPSGYDFSAHQGWGYFGSQGELRLLIVASQSSAVFSQEEMNAAKALANEPKRIAAI